MNASSRGNVSTPGGARNSNIVQMPDAEDRARRTLIGGATNDAPRSESGLVLNPVTKEPFRYETPGSVGGGRASW